jgi:hypothetical protein
MDKSRADPVNRSGAVWRSAPIYRGILELRGANAWLYKTNRWVIVAVHGNKPIPRGTLKSIIEGSGLDVDDFR